MWGDNREGYRTTGIGSKNFHIVLNNKQRVLSIMWVAKFKIKHDDWILDKTVKYHVVARGIPLTSYVKGRKHFHTGMVFLYGAEQDKNRFITSVKNDYRIKNCNVNGN